MPINEWYVPPVIPRYSIIEVTRSTIYNPDLGFPKSEPCYIEASIKDKIYYLSKKGIITDDPNYVWVSSDHLHISNVLSILQDITSKEEYTYTVKNYKKT